jgi:tetratricopeptide (TPR) repeat protein
VCSSDLKLDPNNGKLYALSSYFKSGLGDYQGALRDATKGVQIAPKDVINYCMRADAYFHLGKVKEAIADRNAVIALQPNNPISYCGAAAVYMDVEDFDAAQKLITKALKLDPNHDYAREMAGRLSKAMLKKAVAESKTKNWTTAIGYANSAVQLSPKYGDAYAVRAQLKLWSGDKAGAVKDCDAAEKLHSSRELVSSVRAGIKSAH